MNKPQKASLLNKLKFLIVAVALTATGLQVEAATSPQVEVQETKEKPTPHDVCKGNASVAKSIMRARQNGVPMYRLMELDDSYVFKKYVMTAYEYPRFDTEEVKDDLANDFQDEAYLSCMKQLDR